MKMIPLGPNLIVKADISEKKSAAGIILAAEGSREAQAPDKVVLVAMGEDAFSDLAPENRPVIGDTLVIARYDGVLIDTIKEGDKTFEYRGIQDTRIRCLLKEVQ